MDKNTFQKIHEHIEKSTLDVEQKREFSELFARTTEAALRPVLSLFEHDASWIEKLYENYAHKKEAFITGSMEQWESVLEKEKEVLT